MIAEIIGALLVKATHGYRELFVFPILAVWADMKCLALLVRLFLQLPVDWTSVHVHA
jgi:hypothetical protein